MVPTPTDDDTRNQPTEGSPSRSSGANPSDLTDDERYDLLYRATREAIWDVVGTATLILFYVALSAISLSIALGGLGPFLRGSASYVALVIGVVALAVGVFALVRVYRLVTE
ncbi:hypothetical protein [Halobellus captivus]|uniref:hypothetical protein n=1 Tax=Halobellus captivus TaxID=2592614 RepID=UPI0011A8536A|nr:hypothetical protein [Halobellus captivus]